jgi:hypothetical protein
MRTASDERSCEALAAEESGIEQELYIGQPSGRWFSQCAAHPFRRLGRANPALAALLATQLVSSKWFRPSR